MRLAIVLMPKRMEYSIPINYQLSLNALVYKFISQSSIEFSNWLHDKGYIDERGKKFKLFTMSDLRIDKRKVSGECLLCSGKAVFFFSSPLEKEITEHFIKGIMKSNDCYIGDSQNKAEFLIDSINILPDYAFNVSERFMALSPIVVSKMAYFGGSLKPKYLIHTDKQVEEALENNLKNKFKIVNNKEYSGQLTIKLDRDYINKREQRQITRLIKIKPNTAQEMKYRGFLCPLEIKGTQEIISVAYNCGIGEKTSLASGMLGVI